MNVTLRNNTARSIPIVLDHPAFRNRKSGFRRRAQVSVTHERNGSRTTRTLQREEQGSITLPARGQVDDLHPAIKNCAQVRGLLARGAVTIVEAAKTAPVTTPAPKHSRRLVTEKGAD